MFVSTATKRNPMLLAGDIGGTKTDLAIFSNEEGPGAPLVQAEVHSADYPSLQALAREFLTKVNLPVEHIAETPEVAQSIASARDPSSVIFASAVDPNNPSKLCSAAVDMFVSILGSETANLALKVLATGGVYLAGGIPMRILRVLQPPDSWNPSSGALCGYSSTSQKEDL